MKTYGIIINSSKINKIFGMDINDDNFYEYYHKRINDLIEAKCFFAFNKKNKSLIISSNTISGANKINEICTDHKITKIDTDLLDKEWEKFSFFMEE
jgi:hypothetical protein